LIKFLKSNDQRHASLSLTANYNKPHIPWFSEHISDTWSGMCYR